jgi:cell division protein FtsI (penicillin-binding protein 3)
MVKSKIKPMTPGIPHAARMRAYITGAVVTAALSGVAYRAWALQIDDGAHYRELADRQHAMTIGIPAPRGDVLDARGRPLAVSTDVDSVWASPHDIQDVTETADRLAKILAEDPRVLEAKLGAGHKFVWVARHVAPAIAAAVRDAKLAGIEVSKEPRRWYPGRTIAGPVVGRADIDGNGVDGIELAMNELLAGKRSAVTALRDARGRAMLADGLAPTAPGATVHLSLDRSIQSIADDALADGIATNKAKSGVVVVLDVETSRVLALSSYPTFDPNLDAAHVARDKAVADAFEAGSVMKVFSIAGALDAGVVTPDTTFDLSGGAFKVGPHTIHDVHAGIIKRSSNVGAAKIALRFGREKLYAALKKFGFGAKTGIELPGEQVGMLRDGKKWRDVELATIAFGYGLTVTPLQVAAALSSIAHGGIYTEPRIVDAVVDADGKTLYAPAPRQHRSLNAQTAAEMLPILASVFDRGKDGGTAKDVVVPGFKCGGKTGTANKYDPSIHMYSADHYLASFAGLAPIDHPRLAIVVMIDDPTGVDHYGGSVSGPVFAKVASEALRYLGVPGDALPAPKLAPGAAPKKPKTAVGSGAIAISGSASATGSASASASAAISASASGSAAAAAAVSGSVSDADADTDAAAVPDLRGFGMQRALDAARRAHVAVEVHGTGRVVAQDVIAGKLVLTFSDGAAAR